MGIRYPSFEALETQLDIEIRALNDSATFNGVTKLPQNYYLIDFCQIIRPLCEIM